LNLSFLIAVILPGPLKEGKREDANNNINSHRFQGISIKSGCKNGKNLLRLIVEMKENLLFFRRVKRREGHSWARRRNSLYLCPLTSRSVA
jgi:hypothetical protein